MSQFSARSKDHPEKVTVDFNLPTTLADLVKAYGEPSVTAAAVGNYTIALQNFMRAHINEGRTQAEIQALVAKWVPGTRTPGVKKTPFEKASSAISSLSPEERKALLAKLSALK